MRMRGKLPIFSEKDCWNLDQTLLPIILEGLKKFRKVNVHGYALIDDLCSSEEEWQAILDEIIEALSQKEPEYTGGWQDVDSLEGGAFPSPVDKEALTKVTEARVALYERQRKAMETFGKIFFHLWD